MFADCAVTYLQTCLHFFTLRWRQTVTATNPPNGESWVHVLAKPSSGRSWTEEERETPRLLLANSASRARMWACTEISVYNKQTKQNKKQQKTTTNKTKKDKEQNVNDVKNKNKKVVVFKRHNQTWLVYVPVPGKNNKVLLNYVNKLVA